MPKNVPEKNIAPATPAASHDAELAQELHEMFDEATGERPQDMTRLEQADHSLTKRILVGLMAFFAVLAAISWAGFFFFSPGKERFEGEKVVVSIEGPGEVKSGENVTFAVRYKNEEKVPLASASLELRLPKSFLLTKSEPASEDGTWRIGSIAPGEDGMVTIEGVTLAPLGKELDIQAILAYRPADFNSEFQKVSTRTVVIKDSAIQLAVTGPSKVLPGDKVTIKLDYHNTSTSGFKDIRLQGAWPDSFIPESSIPAAKSDSLWEWKLEELAPDAKGQISVTGSFASSAEGVIELGGRVGFVGESEAFELQRESTYQTTVLKGDLVTALILNGRAEDQPIRFGDRLRYAATYRNTGKANLEDVTLTVTLEPTAQGKLLKWNELKDRAKGVQQGNTITWTKKQVPSLERIGSGEEGTIDFEVQMIDGPIAGAKDVDYRITSSLDVVISKIDGDLVRRPTKTQPIVAKVLSNTSLVAEAHFFDEDGVPVGSGPFPPEVGKETVYRVSWIISNTLHEISELRLSAKLPPNVVWTGLSNVDAGDIKFDAGGGKMSWNLNWMPTTIKTLVVSFDVKIIPTEGDKGRIPTLVDAAIFEAVDKVTGDSLILSTPPLTTALEGDDFASGKGRVQ